MSFISSRNHYFAIPSILASQERVPVKITKNISYLGSLDPGCNEPTLEAGTDLELPYWLASSLASEQGVDVRIPKAYRQKSRNFLDACATSVSLNDLSKNFYEFGKLVSFIVPDQRRMLTDILIRTFVNRFNRLFDWAQCATNSEYETFRSLESFEMCLLERGMSVNVDLIRWLEKGVRLIGMAKLVKSYTERLPGYLKDIH